VSNRSTCPDILTSRPTDSNNRKLTDQERFVGTMKQIVGRRLTYEELTGKLGTDPG